MNSWKNATSDTPVCEIVLPDVPTERRPQIELRAAAAAYLKVPFSSRGRFYTAQSTVRRLLKWYPPNVKVGNMKAGPLLAVDFHVRAEVGRFIRWAHSGEVSYQEGNFGNRGLPSEGPSELPSEATLTFSSIKTSEVEKLMPIDPGRGRFATMKLLLYRHLTTLAEDESGIIKPQPTIANNPRELAKLSHQLEKFLEKNLPDWTLIWNPIDKNFILKKTIDGKTIANHQERKK